MARSGFRRVVLLAAIVLATTTILSAPASAQLGRVLCSGEPTDPDKAVIIPLEAIDLEQYGIANAPPEDEAAATSWWQALLNVLSSLGWNLLPNEG